MDVPHVLVMEDDANVMRLYIKILRKAGYEVYPAVTIQAAINALNSYHFDSFVCDLKMDFQMGTPLLRNYRQHFIERGIQVLIVSGHPNLNAICEELGYEHYLTKPISPSVLSAKLEDLLNDRPPASQNSG